MTSPDDLLTVTMRRERWERVLDGLRRQTKATALADLIAFELQPIRQRDHRLLSTDQVAALERVSDWFDGQFLSPEDQQMVQAFRDAVGLA